MFLYVFSTYDRDLLLSKQYKLLKSDDKNSLYIFENKNPVCYDLADINFVLSNTLTF